MKPSETERQGMRPEWTPSKEPCSGCGTMHQVAVYKYSRVIQTEQGECLASCATSLCPACARDRALAEKQDGLKGNVWLVK